jgi:hypothetical protein
VHSTTQPRAGSPFADQSFDLSAISGFHHFVFGAQPIIEVMSHLTPSFLEQLVGAARDSIGLGESCCSRRWSGAVS